MTGFGWVLIILEAMQERHGDPRNRPGIRLRGRAAFGLPLGPDGG